MNYNSNNGGKFNVPPFNNVQYNYNNFQSQKIDNGAIWFITLAPLFCLFLERLAFSRIVAAFLWIFAYIVCVVLCFKDYSKNQNNFTSSVDTSAFKFSAFVPVLYLVLRNQKLQHQKQYHIFAVVFLLIAFLQNGFVSYYLTNESDYNNLVQTSYVYQIDNFSDVAEKTYETVQEALESYLGHNNIEWSCTQNKTHKIVTSTAKTSYNGKETTLIMDYSFDYEYYDYTNIKITRVQLDDKEVYGEDLSALLMQIFFGDDKLNDNDNDSKYISV